jgi:hypothetical protein
VPGLFAMMERLGGGKKTVPAAEAAPAAEGGH